MRLNLNLFCLLTNIVLITFINLVAISIHDDHHKVSSEMSAQVYVQLISEENLFNGVSESSLYLYEAAIIQKKCFFKVSLIQRELINQHINDCKGFIEM